jgi:hypothetical protein
VIAIVIRALPWSASNHRSTASGAARRRATTRQEFGPSVYAYDSPASLGRLDQAEPLRPILDRRGRLAAAFAHRIAR